MFANAANYAIIEAEFKDTEDFAAMRSSGQNQQKILDFIRSEIETKGYPPSVREICAAVGLRSTSSVHMHLTQLEKQGVIRRDATKPRALELLDSPLSRGRSVPLVGKVTAGQPILAIENIEDYLIIPNDLAAQEEDLFALRVQGESMIEAGILDGDIVVVHSQEQAENGDIVVALIDDEATLKRIFYEDGPCAPATGKPRHGAYHRRPRGCARQTRGARAAFLVSLL